MSEKVTESNTGSDSDQDFDPTADMLVNDFDDEHTLEEEEALEGSNSSEIDDLQRESEMPIEELLALYRNMSDNAPNTVTSTVNEVDSKEDESNLENVTTSHLENEDKTENATSSIVQEEQIEPEDLEPLPVSNNLSRLISTSEDAFYEISDDEEDEEDTQQEDSWRKTIQIGLEYQAAIPDSTAVKLNKENIENEIDDNLKNDISSNRGLLLWNPKELNELEVENYLRNFIETELTKDSTTTLNNKQNLIKQRDNELALFLLLKNNYEIDNALSNRTNLDENYINLFTFIKPWQEEDCQLFEQGLRLYGKDFYQVQKNKLPNKTVNELVNFYYLWKKTERHDTFTSKFKFEKKRYFCNPTNVDLMDHFLDDQQQQANNQSFNSTSSSLNNSQNNNKHTSPLKLLPQSNHITTNHSTVTMDHNLTTVSSTENDLQTIPTTSNLQNEDNSSDDQSNLVINEVNSNDESLISKKSTSITTTECSQSIDEGEGSTNLTDVTTSSEL